MPVVSVLIPAYSLPDHCDLQLELERLLGIGEDQFEIIQIPNNEEHVIVEIKGLNLNFQQVQDLASQVERLQYLYQSAKKSLLESKDSCAPDGADRKASELQQQNKRLKQMLKNQLENTQKMRNDTQKTVQNLKHQFDLLVKELLLSQKRERDRHQRERPITTRQQRYFRTKV